METRNIKDFPEAIWLENPEQYLYVRESSFDCCSSRYLPIKKNETTLLVYTDKQGHKIEKITPVRLIGYEKPHGFNRQNPVFIGKFWWLKGYDVGMPDNKIAYGRNYGIEEDGHIHAPSEAVQFKMTPVLTMEE
jgi:hypothetical protein